LDVNIIVQMYNYYVMDIKNIEVLDGSERTTYNLNYPFLFHSFSSFQNILRNRNIKHKKTINMNGSFMKLPPERLACY